MADMDDQCEDHSAKFGGLPHVDGKNKGGSHLPDHKRGAAHPAKHSKGKHAAQLNPDHGPHHQHPSQVR